MTLLYQLEADEIGTLWANDAKSVQATDGSVVAVWEPIDGTITTDACQTTDAQRPIYRANYGALGYPGIEFDGINDLLSIAHSSAWNTTNLTVIAGFYYKSIDAYSLIVNKWTSTSWGGGWGMVSDAAGTSLSAGVSWTQMATHGLAVGPQVAGMRLSTNHRDMIASNAMAGIKTASSPPDNTNTIAIGNGTSAGSFPAPIVMYSLRIFNESLSRSDYDDHLHAVSDRYGLDAYSPPSGGGTSQPRWHSPYAAGGLQ